MLQKFSNSTPHSPHIFIFAPALSPHCPHTPHLCFKAKFLKNFKVFKASFIFFFRILKFKLFLKASIFHWRSRASNQRQSKLKPNPTFFALWVDRQRSGNHFFPGSRLAVANFFFAYLGASAEAGSQSLRGGSTITLEPPRRQPLLYTGLVQHCTPWHLHCMEA